MDERILSEEGLSVSLVYSGEGTAVLELRGELEVATAGEFRERAALLLAGHPERVVLDLTEVPFIDSAGFSAIIWLYRRIGHPGGLRLVDPEERHRASLELIRLQRHVPSYPDVDSALEE